ncbi:MAG: hypothetical protein WCO89_11030 [Syntrophus sp. (in: bacteria)]
MQTPEPLAGEAMPLQRMGSIIYGEPWQNNRIEGSIAGHWASVESGLTGISFGQLLGTFNPNNYTYQAVAAGGFLETNQYLDMTATQSGRETLRSINVPCIQVGNATLSQTGGTASMQNVTMSNVKFFAYSSGAVPQIWATNGVTGTAVGTPAGTANLSGGGLSANFTMKNWDTNNNKWMATVTNGAGSITGGGTNVQNLKFRGAAAGNISGNNFSGTGAGVVKK